MMRAVPIRMEGFRFHSVSQKLSPIFATVCQPFQCELLSYYSRRREKGTRESASSECVIGPSCFQSKKMISVSVLILLVKLNVYYPDEFDESFSRKEGRIGASS